MALGILALALLCLVVGSFYARRLIGYRTWRVMHYVTFVVFITATAHGIGAGSDSSTTWASCMYAACGLVAFNLTVYRILKGSARGLPEARAVADGPPTPA
jgi:predicted ferric reductase